MPSFPRAGGGRGKSTTTLLLGASVAAVVLYTCLSNPTPPIQLRGRRGMPAPAQPSYAVLQQQPEERQDKFVEEAYVTPFKVPERRAEIGRLLEEEGMEIGAELGVQTGLFANITLTSWTSCKKTRDTVRRYNDRTDLVFLPMFTHEAAKLFPDNYFDYIYVDARHDYCGVTEDLKSWWPKLRENGLMAGHDYVFAFEVQGQDWSICEDGSRNPGAVKGAVMEFALKHSLKVEPIWGNEQPSWLIRKPISKSAPQ